ncbi:hypothetical protein ACFXGA_08580 [Actinosynnema sp. NPDC059335]|uniref:hypothetical protein n=1 Tax=Actinosynnema sp. NPDC059335 TaxID=3346804 RepID=UPI00366E27D9
MSDVAFGLSAGTLNDIAGTVYRRQYPRYFKDGRTFTKDGKEYSLSWDVRQPPAFDLKSPVDRHRLAHDLLGDADPPGIGRDEVLRILSASDRRDAFHVDLKQVDLTLTIDGTPAHNTVSVRVVTSINGSGHKLVITPLSAKVSTGQQLPDWVYNEHVVPIVLEAARQLLAGMPLPIPTVAGIALGRPVAHVADDHLVITANLSGKSLPTDEAGPWPATPFFAQLGPDTIRAVTDVGTRYLEGRTASPHDQTGIGLGTAYYKATVALHGVRADGRVSDDRTITVSARVTGGGAAGINWFFGGSTDGFFALELIPDPVADVRLDLDDAVLSAKTVHVGHVTLKLTPTRGDIVSAVLAWVTNALSGLISPFVRQAMTGIRFDVYRVPTLHVDLEGVHFDVSPKDLDLSAHNGTVEITGRLHVARR